MQMSYWCMKFQLQINYDHIFVYMYKNLQSYKNLRVYKHLSLLGILNQLACNRFMKSKLLVAAARDLYSACKLFPGKTITHELIGATFNRVFTGGTRIEDLQGSTRHLAERDIPIIINFCAQGTRNQLDSDSFLDENARNFTESSVMAARIPNQLMSIKISALVNLNLLEKYNRAVLLRDAIWRDYSKDGKLKAQDLFDAIHKIYAGLITEDIANYLKNIHNFTGADIHEFQIDEITFKMNHHPYYLYETQKNDDLIIKVLLPLDLSQRKQLSNMKKRLDRILNTQFENPNNLRILADAEQSYIQRAIECICEQMQTQYNKNKTYIITTLQNYLKISQKRVDFQVEITKRRNLYFGTKLVRGAYLVEQTKVSIQSGRQFPIIQNFEATTANYLRNFQKITQQPNLKGQIFAVTHNEATIHKLLELKGKASPSIRINFAQLFGLADHLTYMLKERRENAYKFLPWAQTQVMVRYIIRRAEELSQMNYPLEIQHFLLMNELRIKTIGM